MRALTTADLRCPATGKRAFVDEATAMAAIERAWTRKSWRSEHGRMPSRAYLCADCGWWHMTNRTVPQPTS